MPKANSPPPTSKAKGPKANAGETPPVSGSGGVAVAVAEAVAEAVGLALGEAEGLALGEALGLADGLADGLLLIAPPPPPPLGNSSQATPFSPVKPVPMGPSRPFGSLVS
jgi:hypothetical protein